MLNTIWCCLVFSCNNLIHFCIVTPIFVCVKFYKSEDSTVFGRAVKKWERDVLFQATKLLSFCLKWVKFDDYRNTEFLISYEPRNDTFVTCCYRLRTFILVLLRLKVFDVFVIAWCLFLFVRIFAAFVRNVYFLFCTYRLS